MTVSELTPLVVAFGGGVNSTAMLVGMRERSIRPDLVLFADTGGEKPGTYAYVSQMTEWVNDWLGRTAAVVTVRASQATDATLEDNCLRMGYLPSIVYGFKTCSQRWKIQPQDRFLNNWQPAIDAWAAGLKVIKATGYDMDEQYRAKDFTDDKFRVIYPLIEWNWGRAECVEAIQRAGLPVPPKSACFFCPSSKKREVLQLKREHPDLFARAIAMEQKAAPGLMDIKGLGRHWSWGDLVAADEAQFKLFPEALDAPCVCVD